MEVLNEVEVKMRTVDDLIIGAGISGLSYALYCNENSIIVEQESEPGGYCRTFYQDGFVWDFAGHFFHFSTDKIRDFFDNKLLEKDKVICKKNTKIYYNGRYIDYPFQMNIHQLPKEEFIDCLYDLATVEKQEEYDSFLAMLYGKFGAGITEKFLKPYNEKLYACDLNELEPGAMGRFFPYADLYKILCNMKKANNKSYNDMFEYPKMGAAVFVNILKNNINKAEIMCDSKVSNIDMNNHIAEVNGEKILYKRLINTAPLNQFVSMLSKNNFNFIKSKLHANQVLVFNLGFNKKSSLKDVHWLYFPSKDINFYRVGFYDVILGTDRLSMYVEIGYSNDVKITETEISKQLKLTLENLRDCGIITDHELVAHNHIIMNPAYVHITDESQNAVVDLKKQLSKYDIYTIGRYGSWTYCSIEDCMLDAIRLANELGNVQ